MQYCIANQRCTSYYEGTELKANHNYSSLMHKQKLVVLAITKVLN